MSAIKILHFVNTTFRLRCKNGLDVCYVVYYRPPSSKIKHYLKNYNVMQVSQDSAAISHINGEWSHPLGIFIAVDEFMWDFKQPESWGKR